MKTHGTAAETAGTVLSARRLPFSLGFGIAIDRSFAIGRRRSPHGYPTVNCKNSAGTRGRTHIAGSVARGHLLDAQRNRRRHLSVDEDVERVAPGTVEVQVAHVEDVVGADRLAEFTRLQGHRAGQPEEDDAVARPELHF